MGKVYSSQNGVMRGRIGNTIYRKGQNATVASQYQPQVANPKTLGQSVQRAVFATVSQALAAMRSIVNHSHYGVNGRRQNEQRFVEQNIAQLRGLVIGNVQGSVPFEGVLNLKGAKGIQPAPYIISEGTLAFPRVDELTASAAKLPLSSELDLIDTIINQQDYENALGVLGLRAGEQISFIGIYDTATITAQFEGSDGVVQNFGQVIYASRVTFVEQLPEDFDGDLVKQVSGQIYKWNPQIIARSEGEMRVTITGQDFRHLVLGDGRQGNDDTLSCAAIVRSTRDLNGRYNYSNSQMVARPTSGTSFPRAINYVESYMDGATVELGARPFLNNPLQAVVGMATEGEVIRVNATIGGVALPSVLTADAAAEFSVPLPSTPTELYVNVRAGEHDIKSVNIVGKGADDVIASYVSEGQTVNVLTANSPAWYSSGAFDVSMLAAMTCIIMGGSGKLADGTEFTF